MTPPVVGPVCSASVPGVTGPRRSYRCDHRSETRCAHVGDPALCRRSGVELLRPVAHPADVPVHAAEARVHEAGAREHAGGHRVLRKPRCGRTNWVWRPGSRSRRPDRGARNCVLRPFLLTPRAKRRHERGAIPGRNVSGGREPRDCAPLPHTTQFQAKTWHTRKATATEYCSYPPCDPRARKWHRSGERQLGNTLQLRVWIVTAFPEVIPVSDPLRQSRAWNCLTRILTRLISGRGARCPRVVP